jgi:hypothetical protein
MSLSKDLNSKYTAEEIESLLDKVNDLSESPGGDTEGFIPLARDFSEDFNNDYAR